MSLKFKLDDRPLRALEDRLRRLAEGPFAKVGVLASGDGTDPVAEAEGFTQVELAVAQHFGTDRIPARPFLKLALEANEKQLRTLIAQLAGGIMAGTLSHLRALDLLGAQGAAMVKQYMMRGPHVPPALAAATVEAKGSDRPLIDQGVLVNSITHEVHR